jgi:hypothetical protein
MSRFTRTLAVGTTLAVISLAGMTAARAQATDQQATLRPRPNGRSGSPGATASPHPRSRRPRTPPWDGCRPASASPSPTHHRPRCRLQRPPNQTGSRAGSSPLSVYWRWRCWWLAWPCWSSDGHAAELHHQPLAQPDNNHIEGRHAHRPPAALPGPLVRYRAVAGGRRARPAHILGPEYQGDPPEGADHE